MEPVEANKKNSVSFYVVAVVYVLFNLRLGSDPLTSFLATGQQILLTAPYVAGITFVVVSFIQYAAGGEKVPWNSRLRLFFTIGIFSGLVYGIYDYAGGGVVP
ncbi:MAG: hypothetical protein JKY62_05300 [Desulfocapsa sp.]|uniref:Uncharacterized protein n=1 Tax=Desulfotalea psychrophila TaxID=84980 RepID=A0ABS3AW19_9BACT|nr:hypothetical protein [Desulfocapsa sp.]MBN4045943.1 hypothetical protein [bacterium AH-315-P11]MBN4068730.1 hypothetical protein [Desulfotalea psychrophila]